MINANKKSLHFMQGRSLSCYHSVSRRPYGMRLIRLRTRPMKEAEEIKIVPIYRDDYKS